MTKQCFLIQNHQANGRWEARYPNATGQILCKGNDKFYVISAIESGRCNKAKNMGISGPGSIIEAPGSMTVTAAAAGAAPAQPKEDRFTINERFGFLEDYVIGVAKRTFPSLVITGEGGLGKSFTVHKALKDPKGGKLINASDEFKFEKVLKEGVEEENATDDDWTEMEIPSIPNDNFLTPAEARKYYTVVKGFSTAKGLYEVLYHNRNRVIVFDDCDSILKDPTALMLLKGALDSYDKRIISWRAKGFIDDGLPTSFEFKGGIIFISNKQLFQIDQAIRSRSLCVDVTMSTDQKIERMTALVESGEFMPNYDQKVKKTAIKFLESMKHDATEISFRTLIQVVKFAEEGDNARGKWTRRAEYFLVNGTTQ